MRDTPASPTHNLSTHPPVRAPIHQAYEEARDSATESTPVVEEAMFFWAGSGDKDRLTTLLERGTVNVLATDKVGRRAHVVMVMSGLWWWVCGGRVVCLMALPFRTERYYRHGPRQE